jgi:uncharacterized protein DUF3987
VSIAHSESAAPGTPPPLAAFLRPTLPEAAKFGLPWEVASTLAAASGADPAAILTSYLTMFGNALGAQPHAWFGNAEHPGRLFVILVGDAATGRKGTAYGTVKRLFLQADPHWAGERLRGGLGSGEAMVGLVADGTKDPRLLLVEPEMARLITVMGRSPSMTDWLRLAWDGEKLEHQTKRTTEVASRAHISVLGMMTPEELTRRRHTLSQAGGLETRFLYCYTAPQAEVSPFAEPPDYTDLALRTRRALDTSRREVMRHTDVVSRYLLAMRGLQPRTQLRIAPEVARAWPQVKASLPEPAEGYAGLQSRAEPQVMRLAVTYALADTAEMVTMAHVQAGAGLYTYCARSAETVFSVPVGQLPPRIDPHITALLVRTLHGAYPKWLSREELAIKHRSLDAGQISDALDDLADRGTLEIHQKGGWDGADYRLAPPQTALF